MSFIDLLCEQTYSRDFNAVTYLTATQQLRNCVSFPDNWQKIETFLRTFAVETQPETRLVM